MTSSDDWRTPMLSTSVAAAVANYRRGIAILVAGISHADTFLAAAWQADPDFYLAQLGLAVAVALMGSAFVPPRQPPHLTRGERQHAEIVRAAFAQAIPRADDLRREHLLEYPGDLLIVALPSLVQMR